MTRMRKWSAAVALVGLLSSGLIGTSAAGAPVPAKPRGAVLDKVVPPAGTTTADTPVERGPNAAETAAPSPRERG